jgi:hypothetical protein
MYVAIGDDGMRPVVWGMGETQDAALTQATDNLNSESCKGAEGQKLLIVEVSAERAARIEAGDVDASDLWATWVKGEMGGGDRDE